MKRKQRLVLVLVLAAVAVAAIISVTYALDLRKAGSLPPGCTQPSGGFLIIASNKGYNDSVTHGADAQWPILMVHKGATVNITVCNTDRQAHGFQITHYYDSKIESLDPGQVLTLSFVADQTGSFRIGCSTFCTIHLYMQNGQLIVTP